uniref:Uncharacterized protein n=1 Tax=Tanacetum cinerariifolium TaxID=118510 RepID=A0A6L2J6L9_TANCI|nr:hypothetical protein [Tanacetum cinerariifolium]
MANLGVLPNNFVNEATIAIKKQKREENLKKWKCEDVIVITDVDVPNEVGERNNNVELKEEHITVDVPNQHVTHKILLSLFFVIVFIFRICELRNDDDVPLEPIKQSKKHHIKITTRNRLYHLVDSEDDEDETENQNPWSFDDEVVDEDKGENEVVEEDEWL